MKNKVFRYIAFFSALLVISVSCEKTDIQKANDGYDYSKIVPVVQGVTGSANGTQTFSATYTVNYFRGGSTWAWSATNATVSEVSTDTRSATVTFTTAGAVTLTITETTMAGVTSDPFDKAITVAPFCPLTRDQFIGTWTGNEAGKTVGPITVQVVAGTAADEIVLKAVAGIPVVMGPVFTGWGEVFQPGLGPVGDITLTVNANGSLSIPFTYWGQTLPGPYDYWFFGSAGLWSGCGAKPTMSFTFNLDWNGVAPGSAVYTNTVTLTKQ